MFDELGRIEDVGLTTVMGLVSSNQGVTAVSDADDILHGIFIIGDI